MTPFWNGFEKRARLSTAIEPLAAKAEGALARGVKEGPALNYAKMHAPTPDMPIWKQKLKQNAPGRKPMPGRRSWSPDMKQKIMSGSV